MNKIPKILLTFGAACLLSLSTQAQTFMNMDVGTPGTDPVLAGSTVISGDTITIKGGGSDIWNTADGFHYYFTEVTGNFDAKVRVQSLEGPDAWSKAELMARQYETTSTAPQGGDPHISHMTTRSAGQNQIAPQWRATRNGGSQWTGDIGVTIPTVNPVYPDVWLRMIRVGSVFAFYHGTDGVNWSETWRLDTANPPGIAGMTAWPNSINVGLAVTAHNNTDTTGGIAVFSDFEFAPASLLMTGNALTPKDVRASIAVIGSASINSVTGVRLNGADITANTTVTPGAEYVLTYDSLASTGQYLESGGAYAMEVDVATPTGPQTLTASFTAPAWVTIPADYALAAAATSPGMSLTRIFQTQTIPRPGPDANTPGQAEQQIAGGIVDPATGQPAANVAYATSFDLENEGYPTHINYEQEALNNIADNFNSANPAGFGYDNINFPGITAVPLPDYFSVETVVYANLSAGLHKWGVNSDDGFICSVAPGQPTPFGLDLGAFRTGRGASDTMFFFVVEQAGYYPIRLLYWEGNGGANVEWFSENLATGQRLLINDNFQDANAVKTFKTGAGRAYVEKVLPAPGFTGAEPESSIRIELKNGRTSVVNGSVQLFVGDMNTPVGNVQYGATTVVTYDPANDFEFGAQVPCRLVWTESTSPEPTTWTEDYTFTIRGYSVADLPPGCIWIEIEDFNYNSGQFMPAADNVATYAGGAYADLGAVHLTDYYQTYDEVSSDLYRKGESPNVPMDAQTAAGTLDVQRPGGGTIWTVTANHKIGWANGGDWYNYTRTIPGGIYTAVAAFSTGEGTGLEIGGPLDLVDNGTVPDAQQVKTRVGYFSGAGSDGWGNNILIPLRTSQSLTAPTAYFKLPATPAQKTVRLGLLRGDHDWFALVPVTTAVPPQIKLIKPNTQNTPQHWQVRRDDGDIEVQIEDMNTQVEPAGVKVFYDGADVTAQATITKNTSTGVTTAIYDPGLLERDTFHTFRVEATDNATPPATVAVERRIWANLYPTDNIFVIEAEDFNYNGGQVVDANLLNTMPYLGNAYNGLGAVSGVDYASNDGNDSDVYRLTEAPNKNISGEMGERFTADRGIWTMTQNYKLGWVDGSDWANYTRVFPPKQYEVYLAGSIDSSSTDTNTMRASLFLVTTDPSQEGQETEPLGLFRAPGSGAWSRNALIPLTDAADGSKELVALSGTQTIRLQGDACDLDYLVFLPVADIGPEIQIDTITYSAGQVTITWQGTAVLESAPTVMGEWSTVEGAVSGQPITPGGGQEFYRLFQP